MRLLDAQMNVVEYFVHHEDVRRAEDDFEPRVDAVLDLALWTMVKRGARFMSRHLRDAGLELVAPRFGTVVARAGDPGAVVTSGPQELVLLLFGRQKAARLQIEGSEAARQALATARFGI
jgi:uncharacterized protein (TIGR03085 family)